MATGKKYYWIKLKKDFLTGDRIDYLMSQKNGAQYVVLYLLLCMMCINTDGKLEQKIGELIIPYDADKIQRDCKYFNKDTIMVAMSLYQRLGLVYENQDGNLMISDFKNMVGFETDWASQKRQQRALSSKNADTLTDCIEDKGVDIVHTEIRDKRLEIRDKSIENRVQSSESREKTSSSSVSGETAKHTEDVKTILKAWNSLSDIGIKPISRLGYGTKRYQCLIARLNEYGPGKVLEAIQKIRNSDFLQGKRTSFVVTFDWFVKPNNFPKVLEGNYDNAQGSDHSQGMDQWSRLFDQAAMEEAYEKDRTYKPSGQD
ncbi:MULTISPECIES: phage replisome organizer N-terminal domain-containing protein [unclassified Bilifractor]|uniref:phage replisome organizer N-terminal domain-containing protein n=1 Tax=unclassified Bilifractor TaxID=2815795 RepID=UPI003F8EE07C